VAERRRVYKVSERIREIVASALPLMADSRFLLITITSVVVSSDLREAKVYWTSTGAKERQKELQEAFRKATGFFRRLLGEKLDIRFILNLTFIYDDTLDTYEEVQKLMSRIAEDTGNNQEN